MFYVRIWQAWCPVNAARKLLTKVQKRVKQGEEAGSVFQNPDLKECVVFVLS